MVEAAGTRQDGKRANSAALVIAAASLGTMFEWYDFFLYGSLATLIAKHFFSGVNDTTAFIFALAAFAAGFAVRPFGALVFGRIGDIVGRKNTFLVTMTIMGSATFLVGLLPDADAIGAAAPVILVGLRLLQGLAIGGEYGGAAIYVAEHAPAERRGFHTSWINAMATSGLVLSLLVIIACRVQLPKAAFEAWGWRLPFLISAALLAVSIWIRLKLQESPVFQRMKDESALSAAPFAEAFGRWSNLKRVLIALVGSIVGSTAIWYTAQFYALFFLERILKVDGLQTNILMAAALAIAAPSYVLFGWLSDKIGRKPVMLTGCALAAVLLFPLFHMLAAAANPALTSAQARAPVTVVADTASCAVQFDPVGGRKFDARDCDIAKSFLTRAGISYRNVAAAPGARAEIHIGDRILVAPDPRLMNVADRSAAISAFQDQTKAALTAVGYPPSAAPGAVNAPVVIAIIALLVVIAAMTYAPNAAFLVELFPARIRYTSVSFPYHLGSGWVGGFLPASAFAIVTATGDIYAGLWYPVFFVALTAIVGALLLPETRGRPIPA